jgi:5,10-methylenetetrahydromethanopterin reductase
MIQVYDDLPFRPTWPIVFMLAPLFRKAKSHATLGAGVTVPYLIHPGLIASHLACLEEESGQRAFVVLGRGAFHELFDTQAPHPISGLKESAEIIDNLVSGKSVNFKGKIFSQTEHARFRWKSTLKRRKHIPIYFGTWGPRTARLAGKMKIVNGIIIGAIAEPNYIRQLSESLEEGAREVGRSTGVDCGVCPSTIISKNRDSAYRKALNATAVYLPTFGNLTDHVGIPREEVERVRDAIAKKDTKTAKSLVSEKAINAFAMWGTPDDVVEKTERLMASGVNRINFALGWGNEDFDAIRMIGQSIIPALSKGR